MDIENVVLGSLSSNWIKMILATALYYSKEWTFLTQSSCTTSNPVVLLDSRTFKSLSFQSFWDIKFGCLGGLKSHGLSKLLEILIDNIHEVALERPQHVQPHTILIIKWDWYYHEVVIGSSNLLLFLHKISFPIWYWTLSAWRAWFDQM